MTVRMSVDVGRDSLTVLRKGQALVNRFVDSKEVRPVEETRMGPGVYEVGEWYGCGLREEVGECGIR